MPPRFYVPEASAEKSVIELPEEEAAHLTRVLRLGPGDHIRVFNGRGDEWEARVDATGKRRASARLDTRIVAQPEPRLDIHLAAAVLKGDKMDDVVRDAVMLGASGIIPLLTARTEVSGAALERAARIARWQRIAVSSAKQCGRAVVPQVQGAARLDEVLERAGTAIMLVEPSADAAAGQLRQLPAVLGTARAEALTLLTGPEGGWTATEIADARARNAMLLTLGTQTLRADAAPIVALTALRVYLEDL